MALKRSKVNASEVSSTDVTQFISAVVSYA